MNHSPDNEHTELLEFMDKARFGINPYYFVMGKYDQVVRTDPYSALTEVLTQLMTCITQNESEFIREAIVGAMDKEDLSMMTALIPNLQQLLKIECQEVAAMMTLNDHAFSMLQSVFCSFMRTVILATRPIVICLDDLQFASNSSIELIKSLVSDDSVKGMLLLLTFRSEDVGERCPLKQLLDFGQDKENVRFVEIGNLPIGSIDQLVRASLSVDEEEETLALSRLLLAKTDGNPLHLVQFLQMLRTRSLIIYDYERQRYTWALEKIQGETNVSENVVQLVSARIQRLHPMAQALLRVAACLGFSFHVPLLVDIAFSELHHGGQRLQTIRQVPYAHRQRILKVLERACDDGLLEHITETHEKFAHDKVQQLLLQSIPQRERSLLHLRIGKFILANMNGTTNLESPSTSVFLAVHQINQAMMVISLEEDMIDLCSLNLRAGALAAGKFDFSQAADFMQKAIDMARRVNLWTHNYPLALDIFTSASEVECYAGRYQRSLLMADEVITKGRSFDDKLRAYCNKLEILGAEGKSSDALDLGIYLLKNLGEKIPRKPSRFFCLREFFVVAMLMRRRKNENLVTMTKMIDGRKLFAMKVLRFINHAVRLTNDKYLLLATCLRSMALTLQHGLSPFSPCAMSSYAFFLSALFPPKAEESFRLGQLAIEFQELIGCKEDIAFVALDLVRFVNHKKQTTREQFPLIDKAFAYSVSAGQHILAAMVATMRLRVALIAGVPLSQMKHDCDFVTGLFRGSQEDLWVANDRPMLQIISCLQSPDGNTLFLTGDIIDEVDYANEMQEKGNETAIASLKLYQISHAFFFLGWERLLRLYEDGKRQHKFHSRVLESHVLHIPLISYVAMAYFSLAGSGSGKRNYIRKAKRLLREISRSALGNVERVAFSKMVQAEYCILTSPGEIIQRFEDAMNVCREFQFIHYEAILSERLGKIQYESGHLDSAIHYITNAASLYREWTAFAKVSWCEKLLGEIEQQKSTTI
jgi:predicted ATPase